MKLETFYSDIELWKNYQQAISSYIYGYKSFDELVVIADLVGRSETLLADIAILASNRGHKVKDETGMTLLEGKKKSIILPIVISPWPGTTTRDRLLQQMVG
jgi:hypothetical protein